MAILLDTNIIVDIFFDHVDAGARLNAPPVAVGIPTCLISRRLNTGSGKS